MADGAGPALGLSIGATNLAAVTADLAVTRKPVLTLFRQRAPEVGVPSDNPRLDQPGLVIADFVDRVGDPVGIAASDGSVHRSEALVADGVRALAYAATGGRALPESIAVTHPAHWSSKAIDALGAALSRVAEWSNQGRPLLLIPDAAATLCAVRANPGMPARGTVAVCDFGGSGTSITLMDAAGDYQPVAPTVRYHHFSGDLIDQALLTAAMANIPSMGSFDSSRTVAIGSLSRLRTGCRSAKEQLSSSTVATLPDEPAGLPGEIRLTRSELDDAIRQPLHKLVAVLDAALSRNGIRDLVAVVAVGGGANIPAVTTTLAGHFRVPVVTTPRPQLTAAIGGALRAACWPRDPSATAPAPFATRPAQAQSEATATAQAARASGPKPVLAWSESGDESRAAPASAESPRSKRKIRLIPWHLLPALAIIGSALALLLVGTAVAIELHSGDKAATTPGVSTTPAAPASPANSGPEPAPASQPPAGPPAPPTQQAPPSAVPQAIQQGAMTEVPAPQAPPPALAAPPVPPILRIPAIPPIPRIPGIPGITAAIPGLGEIPGLVSQLVPHSH
ncbi:MAG: Hsp70 family protein [Mycobacterium sp.]|uniref:Hsp70 family protein n=1 Tax=Mycobacterium sp. TaxID=1785 RepID=UPI003F991929